jgi:hypothetical protein
MTRVTRPAHTECAILIRDPLIWSLQINLTKEETDEPNEAKLEQTWELV